MFGWLLIFSSNHCVFQLVWLPPLGAFCRTLGRQGAPCPLAMAAPCDGTIHPLAMAAPCGAPRLPLLALIGEVVTMRVGDGRVLGKETVGADLRRGSPRTMRACVDFLRGPLTL